MRHISLKLALVPGFAAGFTLATCMGCARRSTSEADAVQRHIARVEHGLAPALIGRVVTNEYYTRSLQRRMQELHIQGVSVAVIHDGRLEWAKGYGVTEVGGQPVTPATLFQAGSISKPVVAVAALCMVEQNRLALDSNVNDKLVSWKVPDSSLAKGRPVTLRELLTHTAGIGVHGFPGYAAGESVPNLINVLDGLPPAHTPPIRIESMPGEQWNYSGGGYTIVQQLIVDVSGRDFPSFMHDAVLIPMGMSVSTYQQPLPAGLRTSAASPFNALGKSVAGGAHTYPEMAAAGLWTTPSDLARFSLGLTSALQGKAGKVLSAEMTRTMLIPGKGNWGLGLEIGGSPKERYFKHGGVNAGYQSVLFVYEDGRDGAVIMTNSDHGSILADEIMRSIATEYHWPDYRSLALLSPLPALLAVTVLAAVFIFVCFVLQRFRTRFR
jgi:CubicO group peptidase (beta-lactamase class C family)